MDCSKADIAMMAYIDKTIKPAEASALARHVLKCEHCRESFLLFDAAMDKVDEVETGAFALTEAPPGFAAAVMEKVEKVTMSERRVEIVSRADIIMRVLWGLCAIVFGCWLGIAYNQDAVAALAANPSFVSIANGLSSIGDIFTGAFNQLLLALGQMGDQTTWLLSNVSTMSLIIVVMLGALLTVVLRGEKEKAKA